MELTEKRAVPSIGLLIAMSACPALVSTIILPSLPAISEYFNASYQVTMQAVPLYLFATGVLQLLLGPISDRYGRRPVMLFGFFIFLLATIGALLSASIAMFLFFRLWQGTAVVGQSISRAIVRDVYSEREAASYMAYIAMGISLAPMIGPSLGGVLETYFGWKVTYISLFFLGLGVFVLTYFQLEETNTHQAPSFREQLGHYPELFRSRRFWGYTLAASFCAGGFFAFLGAAPFVAINFLGVSEGQMGFFFAFLPIGYMFGNFLSARFADRFQTHAFIIAGAWVSLIGISTSLLFYSLGARSGWSFFAPLLLLGVGNGLTMPNALAGAVSVRPALAGTASGVSGALMIVLGAGLAALSGGLLNETTGANPILIMMIITLILGLLSGYYVRHINRSLEK